MKLLRILTGHHAGAQVVLTPGTHRIGTDDDADIHLTDWRGADVLLTMDESGAVCTERLEAAPPAEGSADESADTPAPEQQATLDPCKTWMIDFVPMQFDDTVLCVGWPDAAWPSDLALLSTLLNAPDDPADTAGDTARMRRRYTKIAAVCVAMSAGIAAISFALTTSVSRAALAPSDVVLEQRLSRALAEARLPELHVARENAGDNGGTPRVVVTGMVRSASDDYIARQLFDRMKPGAVTRRYSIAEDTARGIRDAIGMDGVQVKYDGKGVFTVSGTVADKQHVENALARVRGDFGKSIRQIHVALAEVGSPASEPAKGTFISLVSSGDVQYAQTPDGVKHIYTSPDDAVGASGVEAMPSGDTIAAQGSR